jgi:hypothetical protein
MLRLELWDATAIVHMPCLLVYLNEKYFETYPCYMMHVECGQLNVCQ